MPTLAGQVVIVTGATAGIGAATARRLARSGAKVVIAGRRKDRLDALVAEITAAGGAAFAVAGDLNDEHDREVLVESALLKYRRIDALVNNAGYGTRGPVEMVPVELIRNNFETNVFSLVALTQLVLRHLRKQGSGRIVNIGSVAGRIARPLSSVYDSTKHALEALTDGLRGELRPFGIDVVLIRPGLILTEFVEVADRASAAVVEHAGPYEPYFAGHRKGYDRLRRNAGTSDDIARLVERALTAARPASHYSAPAHAKLFLLLKWILPVRAVDWLVRLKR